MEFRENEPIYVQINQHINMKIAKGELAPGEKLPSVREIAQELRVNPNTVQRCMQQLEAQKIVTSKRGIGSFVTEDAERIQSLRDELIRDAVQRFFEQMRRLGIRDDELQKTIRKMEVSFDEEARG